MSARAWCALKWIGFVLALPGLVVAEIGTSLAAPGNRLLHFAKEQEWDALHPAAPEGDET